MLWHCNDTCSWSHTTRVIYWHWLHSSRVGSMQWYGVRPSTWLSICLPHAAVESLLLCAQRAGDIDRFLSFTYQQPCRNTACSSKRGQCHVVSWRRKLNTDLLTMSLICWHTHHQVQQMMDQCAVDSCLPTTDTVPPKNAITKQTINEECN